MKRSAVATVMLITLSSTACRRSAPPAPAHKIEASQLPAITVKESSKMLFTYAASSGSFETVNELKKVPEASRGWVRVIDLGMKPDKRQDLELVYVADLREARKDGGYPYLVMSRGAFEAAASNRASGGATSPPPSAPASQPSGTTSGKVAIVLYSTSWCSACRAARQYLTQSGISFVEKDIEKDTAAASELLEKARQQGVSASGVPVLDVNGTLMQGFDPQRLSQLLGARP